MIFDSNVLIFLSKKSLKITDLILPDTQGCISIISYIEALGFPFKTDRDKYYMEQICASYQIIPLSEAIVRETIKLREKYKIKLPDAIIYATALVEWLPLLTNNISDFQSLNGKVKLIDPFNL